MKREDYLGKLKLTLEQNDFGPVEEAIAYFDEMLKDRMAEEGVDEEAAVATMDAPEQVASQLAQSRQESGTNKAEDGPVVPGVRSISAKPGLVKSIVVRDRNNRLILRGWDKEEILLRHPETEKIRYDFTLEGGTMSLIRRPMELSLQLFQFESLSPEMREVTLDVPHELAAGLDLRTSNGRLSAEGLNCWGAATLKTSNGSLRLKDFSAKTLQAATSNGSLTLQKVRAARTLSAATSNGKITAQDVSAPEMLSLHTSNGGIEVDGLSGGALELASSNGAIRGRLPGRLADYTVRSATSNGRNNLPGQQDGGATVLHAHTSNARIDLAFDGETGAGRKAVQTGGTFDSLLSSRADGALADVEKRLENLGDYIAERVESGIGRALGRQAPEDNQG